MARPIEKSIEYYPLNCNFLNNIKIRRILKACGASSIAVLIHLLGNIYGDEGYFMLWNEDVAFLTADSLGVKEGQVTEVVTKALQVGFFDSKMFEAFGILTSKGIQRRYFKATEKRKNEHVVQAYLVVNSEETKVIDSETPVSAEETGVNDAVSTQSKVKESKVKESKEKNSPAGDDFSFFETAWKAFPNKKGKNAVSKKSKAAIQQLGKEAILRAVNNYIRDVFNQRANGFTSLAYMHGSTFFNGRYEDYLDADSVTPVKARHKNPHSSNSMTDKYSDAELDAMARRKWAEARKKG